MQYRTVPLMQSHRWEDDSGEEHLDYNAVLLPDTSTILITKMTFYWASILGRKGGTIHSHNNFFAPNKAEIQIPVPNKAKRSKPKLNGEVEVKLGTKAYPKTNIWFGEYFAPAEMFEFQKYTEEVKTGFITRKIPCYASEKYKGLVIKHFDGSERSEDPVLKGHAISLVKQQLEIEKEIDALEQRSLELSDIYTQLAKDLEEYDPYSEIKRSFDQAKARIAAVNTQ